MWNVSIKRCFVLFTVSLLMAVWPMCIEAQDYLSLEQIDQSFSDPLNEYRIVKYQLNNNHLSTYPQYGFGGYHAFFYDNLYKNSAGGVAAIGPLVDAANAQGRTVWSGDDNGYPSGSAGGKVIEGNPEYEVRGVAMLSQSGTGTVSVSISTPADCEKMVAAVLYSVTGGVADFSQGQVVQSVQDTGVSTTGLAGDWTLRAFVVQIRDSNTQAQTKHERFGSTGHYADLLNPDAVAKWISLIHEPTVAEISDVASKFEGFYFNEPSLMQLNWDVVAPYACLSWNDQLFSQFQAMHGYDLVPVMAALYGHDDLFAKRVRMHYHQTVGEMLRTSFTAQIGQWCDERGLALSGHPLLEESLKMHVANFGDMLKVIGEQHVPAVDLPMMEPENMATENYHFPKLMSSTGIWNEKDPRVIGLLDPVIGGGGRGGRTNPSVDVTINTINRAARSGVNLFTTYINMNGYPSTEAYEHINAYAGRISSVLTGARVASDVALYYPINMFQMEYKPITGTHWGTWGSQRQKNWDNLQTTMLAADVNFNIVHSEWLRDGVIEDGKLKIGSGSYRYLVMPDVEVISASVITKIQDFEAAGGTVLWVDSKPVAGAYPVEDTQVVSAVAGATTVTAAQVPGLITEPYGDAFKLNATSPDSLLVTRFNRQGHALYFLVNPTEWAISVHLDDTGSAKLYDPVTGDITETALPTDVMIDGYRSVLVAGNSAPSFTADPINKVNATEGLAYSNSIAGYASDADSDPMTFSLVSGPAWLSVASDGTISGTPDAGDLGLNVFVVQVDTDGGSDTATLNVTVNPTRPNVIVILVDDMGWADSSTYGSQYYQTPSLSRLADKGMLFTNAYAASPLCSPTRASIMSGQYPSRLRMTAAINGRSVAVPTALAPEANKYTGDLESSNRLPLEVNTLAETLKTNGYNTAHIGKWHLAPTTSGEGYYAENQGFDFVIGGAHRPGPPTYYSPYKNGIRNLAPGPDGEYLNERLADECIQWIESVKDTGEPFFLNWWQYAVHGPIIAKQDLMAKYEALRDPNYPQHCPEMATMLESMDTSVGMLLDWLDLPENSEIKANTIIILTSDNGGVTHNKTPNGDTWTSNRPLRGGKANTFEGGVREPWIVAWPGAVQAGATNDTPVQSVDIYPTILEAVGIAPPDGTVLDGESIVSILEGTSTSHQPIFTDFPHIFGIMCAPSVSVVDGGWKLIRYYNAGINAASHAYDLFDLSQDPAEAINLEAYRPDKVQELDALIEAHLADTGALIPLASTTYTGDPRATRRGGAAQAPDRPDYLYLEQPEIETSTAGSLTINLLDEGDQPRLSHAMVFEGSEWVTVDNQADGSVLVQWNAPPGAEAAKVLFGYKGGLITPETNDWTYGPYELLIGADADPGGGGDGIPVVDGSFENPVNIVGSWGMCSAIWNDAGSGQYEVNTPGVHMTLSADGNWIGFPKNMGTIYQNFGVSVTEGDTLEVTFYGGRSLDSSGSAGGGVIRCTLIVGATRYSMTADTTLLAEDTWQLYTHSVTITNTGNLVLEFDTVSGKPWIDYISDVAVLSPDAPADDAVGMSLFKVPFLE